MGSCILSRSFQVERWKDEDSAPDISADNDMDVDTHPSSTNNHDAESGDNEAGIELDDDDDDEDYDDPSNVAMVPMADMFNARYESENVGAASFITIDSFL